MKDGLEITCKDHSVASFMVLFINFPGGNKAKQTNSLIAINHEAIKENFWLPWVLILLVLLQNINFLFFLNQKEEIRLHSDFSSCVVSHHHHHHHLLRVGP
jgi:hypothetical protein